MNDLLNRDSSLAFNKILFSTIIMGLFFFVFFLTNQEIHAASILFLLVVALSGTYYLEKYNYRDLSRSLYIFMAAGATIYFDFYFGGRFGSRSFLIPWAALSYLLLRDQNQWLRYSFSITMIILWLLLDLTIISTPNAAIFINPDFELLARRCTHISVVTFTLAIIFILEKEISSFARESQKILDELKSAQNLLVYQARMSAVGQMATEVAHEINNPLEVILTQAKLDQLSSEGHVRRSQKIIDMVDRIAKIVHRLKISSYQSTEERFLDVEAQALVKDAIELCRPQLKPTDVQIKYAPPFDKIKVTCQPAQMIQVLVNLLNNAIDAVSNLEDKWIKIEIVDSYRHTDFRIKDSGPGISPELLNSIFNAFFTTKDPGKGTGLGLSISRNIIQKHKGLLFVDVKEPNTTFVVRLKKSV